MKLPFIAVLAFALAASGQVYVSAPATGVTVCDSSAQLSLTTTTTAQVIALQAGKSIYVCGFVINSGGSATVRLVQGTGSNCATGASDLTPPFSLNNGASIPFGSGVGRVLKTNSGSALCVATGSNADVRVLISYTVF